jgi:hypothetical protein
MMTMTRGLLQPEILQPEKHTKAITVDNTKPGIQFEIQIDNFAAQGVPLCRDGKVGILEMLVEANMLFGFLSITPEMVDTNSSANPNNYLRQI